MPRKIEIFTFVLNSLLKKKSRRSSSNEVQEDKPNDKVQEDQDHFVHLQTVEEETKRIYVSKKVEIEEHKVPGH